VFDEVSAARPLRVSSRGPLGPLDGGVIRNSMPSVLRGAGAPIRSIRSVTTSHLIHTQFLMVIEGRIGVALQLDSAA
jgi:hypothetical protein